MKKTWMLAMTILAALLVASGTVQAASDSAREPSCYLTCSTCVFIDMYDGEHTVNAPPDAPYHLPDINNGKGVSVGILNNGQRYLVTVTGWVSYWFQSLWEALPEAGISVQPPKHYSDAPGAPPPAEQTHTGYDWECLFAFPQAPWAPFMTLPAVYLQDRVSIDDGVTWEDPVPLGGRTCALDHTYRFVLIGKGLPTYFRISDTGPTYDNYGKYKICVRAICCSTPGDCEDLVAPESSSGTVSATRGVFDPRVSAGPVEK